MLRQRSISISFKSPPNRAQRVRGSLIDSVKKFFDDIAFENWAPRSSRTWRLNLPPKEQTRKQDPEKVKLWETLEEEILRSQSEEEDNVVGFPEASDEVLNDALNERISAMADGIDTASPQLPLSGSEIRELIFKKYERTFDVSFARRDLWGKPIVSLNIMWNYLEQKSFPMSEGQLMEKYDRMAIYLNAWQQANRVRDFLKEPRKAKGGLPSRPIMGIAVSFQLDLTPDTIAEWFDKI